MVSRLGRLRQLLLLSNGFGVFPLSRRGAAQVQETARAREYAATSPLSRVTAAAFPLASEYNTASSPARDRPCVCVCFILCDRLPYTAHVASRASLAPLPSTYCESELGVTAAATLHCPSIAIDSTAAAPCILAPEYRVRPPAIDGRKLAVTPVAPASGYLLI